MTAKAVPKASGSRGLTLYSRLPSKRVSSRAVAAPSSRPAPVSANPRDSTRHSRFEVPAPSAMRRPSSRVLCETAYDITPYKPIAARTSASALRIPTSVTATICADVDDLYPTPLQLQAFAERVAALPVALGHGFVDHRGERGFFVIGACEFTAGEKRNAHGGEVVVADLVVLHGGRFLRPRLVAIDD